MRKFVIATILTVFITLAGITVGIANTEDLTVPAAASQNSSPGPSPTGSLIAVGDICFAGIEKKVIEDPEYPWAGTKSILQSGTILVGNQEVPYSTRGSIYTQKKWTFRMDPRTARSLTTAGFRVVTLANNHIMDYGPLAMQDTLNILDELKIAHTGAGNSLSEAREPAILTASDGTTFAFLAYSLVYPELFWASSKRPGTPYGDPAYFVPDIQKAKTLADYVVVSFHWGNELLFYPKPYQKLYGRKCIDAGASIVLGHHPHVLQGVEAYKGGLIAYSLGNFIFGSPSVKIKDSIILAVDYDENGLVQARLFPVNVSRYEVNYQPRLRYGEDAERVLQDMRTYSKEFKTEIKSQGGVGVVRISK
ncbi:MAG: CapA family protein [Firmicutes bacterium]|nr:CapA family protein [Bacillota bacterium]